jgi:hypothetical protein
MKAKKKYLHVESTNRPPMDVEVKAGALHQQLGISEKKGIATGTLEAAKAWAKRTHNAKLMKRTTFALNARKWHHGG